MALDLLEQHSILAASLFCFWLHLVFVLQVLFPGLPADPRDWWLAEATPAAHYL
jgi:hypothetical protein